MFQMESRLLSCRFISVSFFLGAVFLLNGCGFLFGEEGFFPDRSGDSLNATESRPLVLPEDMQTSLPDDTYAIPQLDFSNVLPEKYEVPRIDPLENIESKGSVVIQKFKGEQWVLIKRAPAQTWPLLLQFLQSNQIPLLHADAEAGLLETDWLRERKDLVARGKESGADSTPADERYQFVLKHGVQSFTTEIVIKQTNRQAERNPGQLWDESSNVARQENMVTLLAEHLAGSPDQSSHSLLAQGIGSVSKVSLEYLDSGEPFIRLQLPFDRGWGSLRLALTKASFVIDDLNREEGIYYTKFKPKNRQKKKAGIFRRTFRFLTFRRPSEKESVLDSYLVKAVDQNNYVQISIARESGPALQLNEQAFMLRKILGKLS